MPLRIVCVASTAMVKPARTMQPRMLPQLVNRSTDLMDFHRVGSRQGSGQSTPRACSRPRPHEHAQGDASPRNVGRCRPLVADGSRMRRRAAHSGSPQGVREKILRHPTPHPDYTRPPAAGHITVKALRAVSRIVTGKAPPARGRQAGRGGPTGNAQRPGTSWRSGSCGVRAGPIGLRRDGGSHA